jgi:hypothetical protein
LVIAPEAPEANFAGCTIAEIFQERLEVGSVAATTGMYSKAK